MKKGGNVNSSAMVSLDCFWVSTLSYLAFMGNVSSDGLQVNLHMCIITIYRGGLVMSPYCHMQPESAKFLIPIDLSKQNCG